MCLSGTSGAKQGRIHRVSIVGECDYVGIFWEVSKIAKYSLYADYQIAAVKNWARVTILDK